MKSLGRAAQSDCVGVPTSRVEKHVADLTARGKQLVFFPISFFLGGFFPLVDDNGFTRAPRKTNEKRFPAARRRRIFNRFLFTWSLGVFSESREEER